MAMEDCYARSYCKQFRNESQCNPGCVAYHQMNNIFDLSGLPKRYRNYTPLKPDKIDLEQYRLLKDWITVREEMVDGKIKHIHNIIEKVEDGLGLFLWSDTKGNGKTSWAAKIMQSYFRAVGMHNNLRTRGLYINVPEFLEDMRRNMSEPSSEFQRKVKLIKTVDMVFFDDIGTESPTNWVREQLYIVINTRYAEGLCNIFTSNIGLDKLGHEDILGDRIASRIQGSCELIHFKGKDRRFEEREARQRD